MAGNYREFAGQDIRAVELAATATAVAGGAQLRAILINSLAGGGAISLKDGGSGGTERLAITHPAVAGIFYIPLPDAGIPFATDLHATLAAGIDTITLFYR